MRKFIGNISADFIKIKGSLVFFMHALIPIIGIILFLITYAFHKNKIGESLNSFLGCTIAAFPVLIGIVTGLAAEQEAKAGSSQEMLFHSSRLQTLFSKIILFFGLGAIAMIIAVLGFAASFSAIFNITFFSITTYMKLILTILMCNLVIYLIHWFISMRFGKNISIGFGIAEMVLGMLTLTVLGDAIWPFLPCAWGFRLLKVFLGNGSLAVNFGGKSIVMVTIPIMTILALFLLVLWFISWEGNNAEE